MDSRTIIKLLEEAGWVHVATKGDHWQFKHPTRPGRVTVPHPSGHADRHASQHRKAVRRQTEEIVI